jgi:hypothetical protein
LELACCELPCIYIVDVRHVAVTPHIFGEVFI